MTFELNVYHTIAIAVVILIVGEMIRKRVAVLRKYCIPVPVVGGLLCTLLIFLALSMMTLQLWQLADLAIPMIVPLVGSLFINLINTFVITGFINFIK